MPVGAKYLILLALAVPPIFIFQWWATLAGLVLVLVILLTSALGLRRIFAFGWYIWFFLGLLAMYQVIGLRWEAAFVTAGNMLLAVLAARMLTLTTSTADLLDALSRGLRVLRHVRINPDAVALMVALMVRSIPFLAGSIEDARAAARARGKERNLALLLTPAVVNAVSYAQRTGEALQARGLPEDPA
nr:CbiQ family ECF transporter T component [Tessaracoccus sp. MC1756]